MCIFQKWGKSAYHDLFNHIELVNQWYDHLLYNNWYSGNLFLDCSQLKKNISLSANDNHAFLGGMYDMCLTNLLMSDKPCGHDIFLGLSSHIQFINGLVSNRLQAIDKFDTRWNIRENKCLTHWSLGDVDVILLTHSGRVTHIWVSDLTIIGSDNGLSPGRRQAIIRTNAGIRLIRPLGTNLSEILIEILIFSFKKMPLKVLSAKRRPFCVGLNVLIV